jgi:hypothetical protein
MLKSDAEKYGQPRRPSEKKTGRGCIAGSLKLCRGRMPPGKNPPALPRTYCKGIGVEGVTDRHCPRRPSRRGTMATATKILVTDVSAW